MFQYFPIFSMFFPCDVLICSKIFYSYVNLPRATSIYCECQMWTNPRSKKTGDSCKVGERMTWWATGQPWSGQIKTVIFVVNECHKAAMVNNG